LPLASGSFANTDELSKKAAITASAKDLIRNFMQIRDLAFKALF
jgi:hypothetical protein